MNYKKILGMLALLWPIVKEIRKYRAEHAEKYGHDLDRICETLRTQQAKSERKVVTLGPRLLLSQQCTRQSRDKRSDTLLPTKGMGFQSLRWLKHLECGVTHLGLAAAGARRFKYPLGLQETRSTPEQEVSLVSHRPSVENHWLGGLKR